MITNEEAIERGLAAASLLSDPTFQSVLKSLTVECFATFTESKPNDKQGREDTYFLYKGLEAIEAELNNRVLQKDEAIKRIDALNSSPDEDDLDGPIYIEGDNNR